MEILERHPLRDLFQNLVEKNLPKAGISDKGIIKYITDLLVKCTFIDNLFRIRDSRGKRIYQVGEMLAYTGKGYSPKDVYMAIGDCSLFLSGLFPESLKKLWSLGIEDVIKIGKAVYYKASRENENPSLFIKLSKFFENCVFGLNCVKNDIWYLSAYEEMRRIIEGKNYKARLIF
ncbi:MAG: hypothetical protein DRP67_03845 [Candidatus Omnitrophota bacterium]|nr:MAG: hypothetical protein DRP67_03845 [Candidatus Omnitrophota bacterium]